jgi:hypothetical protein
LKRGFGVKKIGRVSVCGIALLLTGCPEVKREFSSTLHEDAVVVEVVYTPPRHDSQVGFTAFKTGPVGVDYGGNVGIGIGGGLQISEVTVHEKFAVVFKCKHGEFIVTRKEIYHQLKEQKGKTVVVDYREVYRTTYADDNDGKKQAIERVLVDYDFLGATLK